MSSPTSSPPSSPSPSRNANRINSPPPLSNPPKEGLISRLLITPLTFLSFIISLFLVTTHNHSLRSNHNTPPPTTLYGRTKAFLHAAVFKPTSASTPYAYVQNPVEKGNEKEKIGLVGVEEFEVKNVSGSGGDGEKRKAREGEGEGWYLHTKQKKMMRAEMEDAFRIRKWVVGVLLVGGVGVVLAGLVVGRWVWNWNWGGMLMGSGKGLGGDW